MSLRIYGNRALKTLPGQETRPTPARVRQALFNIWQPASIEGCRWLDLCTGSGAMGAEALCRGASLVIGVEQSSRACSIIQQNWQQVAHSHQTFRVLRGEVTQRLSSLKGQQFDRIYFDPPYASDLYDPVLARVAQYQLLHADGEFAVEHDPDRTLPEQIGQLVICRQKVYSNTALTFYEVKAELEN
ncbi:MAG TPA: 16S rRNA (guanine(966)-N(2))-methyltransferase RsmD [Allocoleopsis sp.]